MGDPAAMTVKEARATARDMLAAIRNGRPASDEETLLEAVAEVAFRRHGRNWKPGTLSKNRHYLRKQILPWFRGRQIAAITSQDVRDWFTSLHATPVAANRSMPVLSVIMKSAEANGLRHEGSNPCKGIRRYRRRNRDRFLSDAEFNRLGKALREAEPSSTVLIIRLLALTGCRSSEIRTLRWQDFRDGQISLRDSKTDPRTVWLSNAAREVLDGLLRTSPWIFPAARSDGPVAEATLGDVWSRIRTAAGLKDVRLHEIDITRTQANA
ncbi:MAG: tyrosine-type recombinase/integrase [Boseongicola sp. SB0662_bin_57]|nr:tyrosine-type recombinase/integrase [Boseongicola sp. SB0662_bin_57]